MGFVLGIPVSADPAERRTPIVPDVATKLRSLGATLLIQRGATDRAHVTAHSLGEVTWAETTAEVMAGSDVVWTIGPPAPEAIAALRPGSVLIGTLALMTPGAHRSGDADFMASAFTTVSATCVTGLATVDAEAA